VRERVGRVGRDRRLVVSERRGVKERCEEGCESVRLRGEKVNRKVGSVRVQRR
jgi:hypothetical protein